ncbi:hypothetical protein CAF53_02440 [Sphingobium sp. LB126]|uniref:hypothetical protein n=1 Tax=Sphingobium sp. LB126 TaxID=1983755 RepID=UPI000C202063|nr:hypothetical protein [Sphingobium sp. LB126]PJG47224.1 hypothetical protein CAF53_02440 [Sphingobium sp. LB126]
MVRLIEDMARTRLLYPPPLPTLPAISVIDIPPHYARRDLPLGRYYPAILETQEEAAEFETFLAAERTALIAPNLFDLRPSRLVAASITIAVYPPPEAGWPHVLLCHFPAEEVARVREPMVFARQAYSIEMFETEAGLSRAMNRLMDTAGPNGDASIAIVRPSHMQPGFA